MRLVLTSFTRSLVIAGLAGLIGMSAALSQTVQPSPADLRLVPQSDAQIKLSFAPIVKKVAPAVVNVYASRKVVQRRQVSPFMDDPFFRRFFGQPGGNDRPRQRVESSLDPASSFRVMVR